MAALNLQENEFYEIHNMRGTSAAALRFQRLHDLKVVMISKIMGNNVVLKWASIRSIAYFFKEKYVILPALDEEDDNVTRDEASMLLKEHIDKVDLCFLYGSTYYWLRDEEAKGRMDLEMAMIPVEHVLQIVRMKLKTDEFYEISYLDIPPALQDDIGFVRVAMVSREIDDYNVEVRVPTMASLLSFLGSTSSSLDFPDFDRVFEISRTAARLFLKRVLPPYLCLELGKRREFWVNEYKELIHNLLHGDEDYDI